MKKSLFIFLALSVVCCMSAAADLYISEFMAVNDVTLQDEDSDYPDWIEIYNDGPTAVDLYGYAITDDIADPRKWIFPATNLASEGYLVVFASNKDRDTSGSELHANFKLTGAGEYLALVDPSNNVLHAYDPNYPEQSADISYGIDPTNKTSYYFMDTPTPGALNNMTSLSAGSVFFSLSSQMFTTNTLLLSLSNETAGANIYYTTDGSRPSDTNGNPYTSALSITESVCVKAAAQLDGHPAGSVSSEHFIQFAPEMAAFTSGIPILVIENFNAGPIPQKGIDSESDPLTQVPRQPATLTVFEQATNGVTELSNSPTLMSRMGIRVRGNSSTASYREHMPYSVELWNADDGERDERLLGMPEESDWILYWPWHNGGNPIPSQSVDTTLMYNTFIYELSNEIDRYAARTRHVEMFVNTNGGPVTASDYVGIYVLMEKVKRDKNRIDFDALSDDGTTGGWLLGIGTEDPISEFGELPQNFRTAGPDRTLETSDDIPPTNGIYLNFDSPSGYLINTNQRASIEDWFVTFEDALYGTNYTDPDVGYAKYLDSSNFIDYFLLHDLTGNFPDGLFISMWVWKDSPTGKLKMGPVWDYDWAYGMGGYPPTMYLRGNAHNLWYGRLWTDPDFWQAYVDRWHELRQDRFSDTNMMAIIDRQTVQITEEAALRNGTTNWVSAIAGWKSWIIGRGVAIDGLFEIAPSMTPQNVFVTPGDLVQLSAPSTPIYYTTNGEDPRSSGGGLSPHAIAYTEPGITITDDTRIIARVLNAGNWSAPTEGVFLTGTQIVAVSEIMYHARQPVGIETNGGFGRSDFDYIEIQNTSAETQSLLGLSFSDGITFDFTRGRVTTLPPQACAVVVENFDAFTNRYPNVPTNAIAGIYDGDLDDSGERIRLTSLISGEMSDFTYNDTWSWPLAADGAGHSLIPLIVTNQTNGYLNYHGAWRQSTYLDGSPGTADPAPLRSVVLNEIMAHTDYSDGPAWQDSDDWIELYNTTNHDVSLSEWYLSDDMTNLQQWAIPATAVITARQWMTFSEVNDFHTNQYDGFGINKAGEQIFLSHFPAGTNARVVDAIRFKGQENDRSYGRYPDGDMTWSALIPTRNAMNLLFEDALLIKEIMYYPAPTDEFDSDRKFIELLNISGQAIDLWNSTGPWRLNGGVEYVFPSNTTLAAGERLLVLPFDPTNSIALQLFLDTYHFTDLACTVAGPYNGELSNLSDRLTVERPLAPDMPGDYASWVVVDEVIYFDRSPWPDGADGTGRSIRRINNGHGNTAANWRTTLVPSPGIPQPAVAITEPAYGLAIEKGENLSAIAEVEPDLVNGAVQQITFYANDSVISVSTASPYLASLSSLNSGVYNYQLTAVLQDDLHVTTSLPVVVTYGSLTNSTRDADADGLPDFWEESFFLGTNVSAGTNDSDGDGFVDYGEYIAGTDPTNPASYFVLDLGQINTEYYFRFKTITINGMGYGDYLRYYDLFSSTNLLDGSWQTVSNWTNLPAHDDFYTFTNRMLRPAEFFRVRTRLE
ncbi:lamin tail domain-containing protein [Verrucomicrobiota bacterium]